MKIELIKNKVNPIDISVGSARTCYSKKIIKPDQVTYWEKRESLLIDLFKSGHHTTLQHVNFTFLIEDISRLSIWRFFHSHRFYNSDQVSQRYTEVQPSNFLNLSPDIDIYHNQLISNYHKIVDILTPIYEKSKNPVERKNAKRKAMENARYILPQSVTANLYHTINLSTLVRYYFAMNTVSDCRNEIIEIVTEMVDLVLIEYPDLRPLFNLNKGNNLEFKYNESIIEFYDKDINTELISYSGFEEDIEMQQFNGDTSGLSALMNSELGTASIKFKLKLSLTADAQNQRHRTAYGIRPSLETIIEKNKHNKYDNYYIPDIFNKNDSLSAEALSIYLDSIELSIQAIAKNKKYASYLLLSGFIIPIIETNSGLDFIHKAEKRLCLNSQEEITKMTWNMVLNINTNEDLREYTNLLVPPCVSRFKENINPICPEGSRFCGIKEWKSSKYLSSN